MIALFNLEVPHDRARSDVDARLDLEWLEEPIEFELKSTTGKSVSTVRDFGPEHIAKWQNLHWLFAFYEPDGTTLKYCYYASPADMSDWIAEKEQYIRPDMVLAEQVQSLVNDETLSHALGDATSFSLEEARLIMKNQWKVVDYKANSDLPGDRYSRERMVWLMQQRLAYVIRRGATLNNPHIPESYFVSKGLERITKRWAATVESAVRLYMDNEKPLKAIDSAVIAQANAADRDAPTA